MAKSPQYNPLIDPCSFSPGLSPRPLGGSVNPRGANTQRKKKKKKKAQITANLRQRDAENEQYQYAINNVTEDFDEI